jgi:hypothetical protein
MISRPVRIADEKETPGYEDWFFVVDANGEMVCRCTKKETADIIVDSINENGG